MAGPVGLGDLTDANAVRRAIAECDRLGRDAFLAKHGFGRARAYFLRVEGKAYDSKAIAGVAFGYQHRSHGPLRATDFSGGEQTVWRALTRLGFEVDGADIAPSTGDATPTSDPDELAARATRLRRAARAQRRPLARPPGNSRPPRVPAQGNAFVRDPWVVAFVLDRAGGYCELCKSEAPFNRENGEPFLEVHHAKGLAEGGPDVVENAAALCPNCHRELHHGHRRSARRETLYRNVPGLTRF